MMIMSKWKYLKKIYYIIEESCSIYWFKNKTNFDHRFKNCNDFRSDIKIKWFDFRETNIEWKECKNTCWLCIKSSDQCKMYSDHRKCQSQNCVLLIIMFAYLFSQSKYKDVIHRVREREFSNMKTFEKWLIETTKKKILEKNESNAFAHWNEMEHVTPFEAI